MGLLNWIGQQRERAIAALVLISILTPPIGAILKPYLTHAVIGLLCVAFLRIDISAFRSYIRRPKIIILASVWTTFIIPVLIAVSCKVLGIDDAYPDLFMGLMLYALASPVMSAPTFAALMGLDATLVLFTLIVSSALLPISAPMFVSFFDLEITLTPIDLGLKLLAIVAGSAVAGLIVRWKMGAENVQKFRNEIDGINIIILYVFVSAAMGGIGVSLVNQPVLTLGFTLIVFAVFFLMMALTYVVFLAFGKERAIAIAMMTSLRNMSLMIAGIGGLVSEVTWLFFAVGQFPIYLSPLMFRPLAKFMKPIAEDQSLQNN